MTAHTTMDANKSSIMNLFKFEGQEVRVLDINGTPWWVLSDVCTILEIANPTRAADRLDEDERTLHTVKGVDGKPRETNIINESGLWSLVLTSRKAAAKRFKKWVTAEVIPSIRKTGGYMLAAPDETPEELALRAMNILQETVKRQKAQLEEVTPKAEALEELASLDGQHSLRDAAKQCGWTERAFVQKLQELHWVYPAPVTGRKCAYADKVKAGLMDVKNVPIVRSGGQTEGVGQPMITQKGLARLRVILGVQPGKVRPFAKKPETEPA